MARLFGGPFLNFVTMLLKTVKIGEQEFPVHFGINALAQISDVLGIDFSNFIAAISTTGLSQQLQIATIGLNEGQRISGIANPQKFTTQILGDLLDSDPEALDSIISVYFFNTFGKSVDAFFEEMKGKKDEGAKNQAKALKNAWEKVTKKASQLPSQEYRK